MAEKFAAPPTAVGLGIMGCSSFALRAMAPALADCASLRLVALASRDLAKAQAAAAKLHCEPLGSYEELLARPDIAAIYMPLPTGLHEEWVLRALAAGKHLLVEKSFALNFASAQRMVAAARERGLLILENFLFLRHAQIGWVREQVASGVIGDLKFFRAAFTIPPLDAANYRYDAALGGGALLDVAAYMIRSTRAFLGEDLRLLAATVERSPERDVDLRGTATFQNRAGVVAQTFWGFDAQYQCTWDLHGTAGRILCERSLTPPPGVAPPVRLERGTERQELQLPADNHYVNQWNHFAASLRDPQAIAASLKDALRQAQWLEAVQTLARTTAAVEN